MLADLILVLFISVSILTVLSGLGALAQWWLLERR